MADEIPIKGPISPCCPTRYLFVALACIGITIYYGFRVNLSIAMQGMLNYTGIREKYPSPPSTIQGCDGGTESVLEDGEFIWSSTLQGSLLSCYFWGYLVGQFPGAIAAEKLSAKYVVFFSVLVNIICNLLTPILTKMHWSGLLVMRIIEGFGGGMVFPACHTMIGRWAPPVERATISALIYTGASVGTALAILSSGAIHNLFGWEAIFYFHGGVSIPWLFIWAFCVQDTPFKQKFISAEERGFLATQLGENKKKKPTPWGPILKSFPVWICTLSHGCLVWGWYLYLVDLPVYMTQILKFELKTNAFYSALPYIILIFFTPAVGKTVDALVKKEKVSVAWGRKIANIIASAIPIGCLIGLCFVGCQPLIAVVLMTIGCTAMGALFSGPLLNIIDLTNNYSGIVMAIVNTVGTSVGIVVPLYVGWCTNNNETMEAWIGVFITTIVILAIGLVAFTLFAKGEEQYWNKQD